MATIQSYNTATANNSGSTVTLTITKPTGLVVGDLLFAQVGWRDVGSDYSSNTPSGWTLIQSVRGFDASPNTGGGNAAFYKVADSSDVAASNFSFTLSGSFNSCSAVGILARIDGISPTAPVGESNAGGGYYTSSSGATFSNAGITPSFADSFLIMCCHNTANTGGFSSQAIATSNPSWTELVETNTGDTRIALTYATRPESTATGNFSWSVSGVDANSWAFGILVAIKSPSGVTVYPSTITSTGTLHTPTISGGAIVSPSTITATSEVKTPTVSEKAWRRQTKSAKSWNRTSKS